MARAIDVVQVKAEIAAEKLAVIIENGSVLLKDMQSGEAVDHDCTNPDGGCSNNYDRFKLHFI